MNCTSLMESVGRTGRRELEDRGDHVPDEEHNRARFICPRPVQP